MQKILCQLLPQESTNGMEVDSATSNHVDESKEQKEPTQKEPSSTTPDARPAAAEMTSADYYFDSYAHFGK